MSIFNSKTAIPFALLVAAAAATLLEHSETRTPEPARSHVVLTAADDNGDYIQSRHGLVNEVELGLAHILQRAGRAPPDPTVLAAMRDLPRHGFVPDALAPYAYLNRPLPVGYGQTVSQPLIVALMTDLASARPGDKALQIGIGGGYQAALLARLGATVNCVELFQPVADAAMVRLLAHDIDQVQVRIGDGYYGWPERGPYDLIIVRQAVHHIPPPLLAQLKPGGRLVMPVGPPDAGQHLVLVTKSANGDWKEQKILPVRFTTLPGGDRI